MSHKTTFDQNSKIFLDLTDFEALLYNDVANLNILLIGMIGFSL